MEGTFNPYAEWLGIARTSGRPNHYALLGVTAFESDAAKIAAAAQRRIETLARVQAGPRDAIRRQLLGEIQRAKQTLADSVRKQQYDERLREKLAVKAAASPGSNPVAIRPRTSPVDEHRNTSAADLLPPRAGGSAPGPLLPVPVNTVDPMAPVSPSGAPLSESANGPPSPQDDQPRYAITAEIDPPAATISDQLASARLAARKLAVRRQKAPYWALAAMLVLLVIVAGGLAVGIVTGVIRFEPEASITRQDSDDPALPPPTDDLRSPPADRDQPATDHGSSVPPAVDRAPETSGTTKPQTTNVAPEAKREDSNVTTGPTEPPVDPAQEKRFKAELAAARIALGARKTQEADKHIQSAKQLSVSDEQKQRAAGIEELSRLVEQFWKAVDEGLKGLEDAGELTVGSTIVSIVEVNKDRLVIRANGRNRRYPMNQLPAGIAVAIANRFLNEQPDSKLCMGAFYFVDPRTDVAEAKRLWEEAAASGAEVQQLLGLLPLAAEM